MPRRRIEPAGDDFGVAHLMHHLWPSVSFYNYARLFERLRPVLIKGVKEQGLMVGPYVRDKRSAEGVGA
jgi:fatty acid desaturase